VAAGGQAAPVEPVAQHQPAGEGDHVARHKDRHQAAVHHLLLLAAGPRHLAAGQTPVVRLAEAAGGGLGAAAAAAGDAPGARRLRVRP